MIDTLLNLFTRVDLLIVVLYLLAMLAVAWKVSDGARDVEGYTVGNRSLPGWVVGISVLGTYLSSITFLGLPGKTFDDNWNAYVFSLALVPAAWIGARYFVPLYREKVQLSAYEFLEQRFGTWARLYAVLSYTVLQLIRVATVLLLVAFPLKGLLGWDIQGTVILLGGLVIVYDTLGGIRAVIWTDVAQVFILLLGAGWCLVELFILWPDGAAEMVRNIPIEKISLGETFNWDLTIATVLVTFLYGLSENVRNYGTDQNYIQRMLAAGSQREAAKAIWLGAVSYLPLSLVFCLIGTGLYMHAQLDEGPMSAAAVAADRAENFEVTRISPDVPLRGDEAFPRFIQKELPRPVAGLIIAAIMAAAMSTVDSSLNSSSTVVLVDILRPLVGRYIASIEIYVLRGTTITLGIIGTGMAVVLYDIYQSEAVGLMDLWWKYAGVAGGGLFGLFLLAWLLPSVPSWGALIAVLATLPVLAAGVPEVVQRVFHVQYTSPVHPYLVGISGTVVMLIVGLLLYAAIAAGLIRSNQREIVGKASGE